MNALLWLTKDFRGIPRTFIALTEMLGLIWIDLGSIRSCFIGNSWLVDCVDGMVL